MRIPHVTRQKKRMNRTSARHLGLKALVGEALGVGLVWAGSHVVHAQPAASVATIGPGEYLAKGGWATLSIKRGTAAGALPFSISAMGSNGHSCEIEGEIKGRMARVPTDEPNKMCEVLFDKRPDGAWRVSYERTAEACQHFCGMRAVFYGDYVVPPEGCGTSALSAGRKRFSAAYRAKEYQRAHDILAPLAARCEPVMNLFEKNDMANDLAVTLYNLGKVTECRSVLAPMAELARTPAEDIEAPPVDAEILAKQGRAARTNLKLCGVTVEMKRKK